MSVCSVSSLHELSPQINATLFLIVGSIVNNVMSGSESNSPSLTINEIMYSPCTS